MYENNDWIKNVFEPEAILESKPVDENNEKKEPAYVSRKGFIEVPTLRGHSEVQPVWDMISPLEATICGGFVRFMCAPVQYPTQAGDMDIYCRTAAAFDKIKDLFLKSGLTVRHENEMAFTYERTKDPKHPLFICPTIQLIKPVIEGRIVALGTTQEVIENFDFTVIRAGLISPKIALVDADFEHDEVNKIIRIKNIHCPISSTLRCMKYAKKGYWLPPMQATRLFIDWDSRTDAYKDRLVDFLQKSDIGEGLTQEEIDELEALMRVD